MSLSQINSFHNFSLQCYW